jgi:hypothetical protein
MKHQTIRQERDGRYSILEGPGTFYVDLPRDLLFCVAGDLIEDEYQNRYRIKFNLSRKDSHVVRTIEKMIEGHNLVVDYRRRKSSKK